MFLLLCGKEVPQMERHVEAVRRNAAKPLCDRATLRPFDVLRFSFVPRLHYWMDGKPGKRTLFIEDEEETVVISFEEGMRCLDMVNRDEDHCFEYRRGLRYLHQARVVNPDRANASCCSFFHMEITDHAGAIHYLPGQMLVRAGRPWADGVEPVLIEILNSITIVDIGTTDCA